MRPEVHRSVAALALLGAASAAMACTEDPITGPPGEGIDDPASTVEVTLSADEFLEWRDTTFTGFAVPTDASFTLVADEEDFRARTLLRYENVPDSVTVDSVRFAIEEYRNLELRFVLDTAASSVPEDGFALRVVGLERGYDPDDVTWELAAEGQPWSTAGGDLGGQLGSVDLTGVADSVFPDTLVVPITSASDSLLSDWARTDGGRGAALLVDGPGARLRLRSPSIQFDTKPVGRDTLIRRTFLQFLGTNSPITFIYDPPQPDVGSSLRLGGLPANRFYLAFVPPDSVGGVSLVGATINRAELVFRPLPAPAEPFPLETAPTISIVDLAGDPFVVGAKTPLGGTLESGVQTLVPDSLAAGAPVRFDFTPLMARWAASPDSFGTFTVGVRFQPDAQSLGFWDFGSADGEAGLRPFVRVVLTPPTDFDVP